MSVSSPRPRGLPRGHRVEGTHVRVVPAPAGVAAGGQGREAAETDWKDSGYVFTRPDGAPIEGSTLTRHFTNLLRQARLRRIRFHDLRHSAATLLLEQGVELIVIKELLGHAHIGVTATVYARVRLRLQRDAIDLLGHALRNPAEITGKPDDGDEPPLCAAPVR